MAHTPEQKLNYYRAYRVKHKAKLAAQAKKYWATYDREKAGPRKRVSEEHKKQAQRRAQKKYYEKNRERRKLARWKRLGLPEPTRPMPGLCECCKRPLEGKALALDHDHVSGKFRGWLCVNCNTAIGKLGDSIGGLKAAITYLRRKK